MQLEKGAGEGNLTNAINDPKCFLSAVGHNDR